MFTYDECFVFLDKQLYGNCIFVEIHSLFFRVDFCLMFILFGQDF